MKKLIEGLHHFRTKEFVAQKSLFEKLSHGQNPSAVFITCSDSRVMPNLITQTAPGELFIIRNAGNIVPPHGSSASGEIGTIEYAIKELKIEDIIVCGHTLCGAMKAVLADQKDLEGMPALSKWLSLSQGTKQVIDDVYRDKVKDPDELLQIAVQENVLVQLAHLRTLPIVQSAQTQNKLTLHGWVYKIQTGEVFAYDSDLAQYTLLTETSSPKESLDADSLVETRQI